jgi:hypothetical protein
MEVELEVARCWLVRTADILQLAIAIHAWSMRPEPHTPTFTAAEVFQPRMPEPTTNVLVTSETVRSSARQTDSRRSDPLPQVVRYTYVHVRSDRICNHADWREGLSGTEKGR